MMKLSSSIEIFGYIINVQNTYSRTFGLEATMKKYDMPALERICRPKSPRGYLSIM